MSVKSVQTTINGQTYTLTYDAASGAYKTTITAPSKSSYNNNPGHYYPVSVTATDDAGNVTSANDSDPTFGESCKLRVKEKVAPIITVAYPTSSSTISNSSPTIRWTVKDDDSGVDSSTISIKIDSGAAITDEISKTAVAQGYECSYTPTALSDGVHTFYLNAKDNDGNASTQVSTQFTIDTTPPVLIISEPADNIVTNQSSVLVAGTTNDVLSSPVTLTINGEVVTVNADGSFSHSVTLKQGVNEITITATDKIGKATTVTRTVTFDDAAPVISEITITPNPVDCGATYIVSVKVTD